MITNFLIIDPQVDFCNMDGSLYVKGAENDIYRLANYIDSNIKGNNDINRIYVSMDSHCIFNISSSAFWINASGQNPNPFTIITLNDIDNGIWFTSKKHLRDRAKDYVEKLAKGGKYPLCIWPDHCITGTRGGNILMNLDDSLQKWSIKNTTPINYVLKGMNPMTENYSIFKAEVPIENDPATMLNTKLLNKLDEADVIYVAGEALSHCVANSVKDMIEYGIKSSKITLLTDATSNVAGFEELGNKFIEEMTAKGMKLAKTTDIL